MIVLYDTTQSDDKNLLYYLNEWVFLRATKATSIQHIQHVIKLLEKRECVKEVRILLAIAIGRLQNQEIRDMYAKTYLTDKVGQVGL